MALLNFNPRKYLEEIGKTKENAAATVATPATVGTDGEPEAFQGESPLEATSFDFNDIPFQPENQTTTPATVATVARDSENSNHSNEIDRDYLLLQSCYSPATGCYSSPVAVSRAAVARSRVVLREFDRCGWFDETAVVDVLRDGCVEFMERAAIAEVDGNVTRTDAEQLALEELIIEWWHNSPASIRSRNLQWGDVRRLVFKSELLRVSES